ncbi:hypothetical protein [Blastomonas sp.]|uniref:hypothetical protein n=1 Tax=Blastomonas sp. TaxID=1909299 RepID=UPI00406A4B7C
MALREFRFPALQVHQGDSAPPLILLSASAVQLEQFAGIPQKQRVQEGETIGFQRDADKGRIESLAQFYSDPQNVIHNPLLCALRAAADSSVTFVPSPNSLAALPPSQFAGAMSVAAEVASNVSATDIAPPVAAPNPASSEAEFDRSLSGELVIRFPDYSQMPLLDLFRLTREALETRVPEMLGRDDPAALIAKLASAQELSGLGLFEDGEASDDADDEAANAVDTLGTSPAGEEALFEESHVSEFWAAVRAREVLLTKLGSQHQGDSFLGFNRDALEAYLRPIVLVDGQHRLLGAMAAARNALNTEGTNIQNVGELIRSGIEPSLVEEVLLLKRARRLPVSLLMDPRPAEHVFQFVVVNQKATPVRPALLATIISTSLSQQELDPITERLENAGIPLRSSRAITYLSSNEASPFAGLVARGLAEEGSELLPWTVLGQLVGIFRDLKGGRFFHERKDYADIWRRRFLEGSEIVEADSENTAYDLWREPEGPWRGVFIAFWSAVRDQLANTANSDAPNFWGKPRSSNLFNKPSLLTLAVDFFAFLVESRKSISAVDTIDEIVDDWLLGVDRNYFARDWKLTNVKKDSTGTRKQWSSIWQEYRLDPKSLPNYKRYSVNYKEG